MYQVFSYQIIILFDSRIYSESPHIKLRYYFELLPSGLYIDLSLNSAMKSYLTTISYCFEIRYKWINNMMTRSSPYYIFSFLNYMISNLNYWNIDDLRKFIQAIELTIYLRRTVSSRTKFNFDTQNYFLVWSYWSWLCINDFCTSS